MPFAYDTFIYDYSNFDYIKNALSRNNFFSIFNKHPGYKDSYIDSEGYTHVKYLCDFDKQGYENGESFEYILNKDLFRGKHFEPLSSDNFNILAIGCSYTLGYGLPEEYSWPRMLEKEIGQYRNNAKVFNLGSPGLGIDAIINNTISFIDKYGAPDAIFALLPDMNRHITYHNDWKEFMVHIPSIDHLKNKKRDKFLFSQTKNYVFENRILSAVSQIRMLEQLCKAYKIDLVWHSWPGVDVRLYSELNFDSYVPYWGFEEPTSLDEDKLPTQYRKYFHGARDAGIHPGVRYYLTIVQIFLNRWKERYA